MATMKQPVAGKTISAAPGTTAIYGALAGMMEALVCHPLDTIKVNMQTKNTTATLLPQKPGGMRRHHVSSAVDSNRE
ncbi:hypothetical protein PENSOL_c032G04405 [Penicillium solitum]|uniref:Mitochondrial thiamine pyrophosphate carrier 1 n=1 Tax=Penicillium solitum TaxID=60172 RepID=A0A1V6QWA6_9EURO|nr:uncharacterized protein PENSOL_c032G04405 [Penicillium solitum]OQD93451.1 hypothetical protein PENSOL_c032G04405 [Penicillium solitum]